MEGRYGLYREGSGVWRSFRDGDFEEGDVWGVLEERKKESVSPKFGKSREISASSSSRKMPSSTRLMIPKDTRKDNQIHESRVVVHQQSSAPVNIPDWSKVQGKKSSKKNSRNDYSWHDDDDDDGNDDSDDDGDDDDEYKLPPHELIARRLARSHISSFSVFEGVGRTLKGRDLSKVRNAILTKTGFLE